MVAVCMARSVRTLSVVVAGLWVAGCSAPGASPVVTSPPSGVPPQATAVATSATADSRPRVTAMPTTLPTAMPAATATRAPAPSAVPARAATAPPTPQASAVDARKAVLTEADLGSKWKADQDEKASRLEAGHALSTLRWSAPSGPRSPEGFSAISTEVMVYPDAAAARTAVERVLARSSCQPIGAPSVGDLSHACTMMADSSTRVVFIEAASGNLWLRAGVYGSPQSQVKETRAAELIRTMISRLPAGAS